MGKAMTDHVLGVVSIPCLLMLVMKTDADRRFLGTLINFCSYFFVAAMSAST